MLGDDGEDRLDDNRSLSVDPYDNLYQVLSGSKTFTLLSPIEGFLLDREHGDAQHTIRPELSHLLDVPNIQHSFT